MNCAFAAIFSSVVRECTIEWLKQIIEWSEKFDFYLEFGQPTITSNHHSIIVTSSHRTLNHQTAGFPKQKASPKQNLFFHCHERQCISFRQNLPMTIQRRIQLLNIAGPWNRLSVNSRLPHGRLKRSEVDDEERRTSGTSDFSLEMKPMWNFWDNLKMKKSEFH
jgi:hypothetical protein